MFKTNLSASRLLISMLAAIPFHLDAAETLAPLDGDRPPQTLDALWAGYDPRREPLDVEIVREWKEGGITTRLLVYTVGTFKGQRSRIGAYYAFSTKHVGKIPGILQMHGGGQRAQRETVEAAAANGYACIAINWGGKALQDQGPDDPGTDRGAVDATQTGHNSHYSSLQPDAKTPELQVALKTEDRIPLATLAPDRPDEVVKVDIYYSVDPHALTRFWRTAAATRSGDTWSAACPLISGDMPLFVMADVFYPLNKKIHGPPWQRSSPDTFMISSWGLDFEPAELRAAGVRATDAPQRMIEADFDPWQDWYQLERGNSGHRQAVTRKIKDPKWRGPDGAMLAVDVLDPAGGEFALTFGVNGWGAYDGVQQGRYYAAKPLAKSDQWQTLQISLDELVPLDDRTPSRLGNWQHMTELGIVAKVRRRQDGRQIELAGSGWPMSRKLRNLRWVGDE